MFYKPLNRKFQIQKLFWQKDLSMKTKVLSCYIVLIFIVLAGCAEQAAVRDKTLVSKQGADYITQFIKFTEPGIWELAIYSDK